MAAASCWRQAGPRTWRVRCVHGPGHQAGCAGGAGRAGQGCPPERHLVQRSTQARRPANNAELALKIPNNARTHGGAAQAGQAVCFHSAGLPGGSQGSLISITGVQRPDRSSSRRRAHSLGGEGKAQQAQEQRDLHADCLGRRGWQVEEEARENWCGGGSWTAPMRGRGVRAALTTPSRRPAVLCTRGLVAPVNAPTAASEDSEGQGPGANRGCQALFTAAPLRLPLAQQPRGCRAVGAGGTSGCGLGGAWGMPGLTQRVLQLVRAGATSRRRGRGRQTCSCM